MDFPPKTILIFCDGTGQDGLVTDQDPKKEKANHYTNVLRLSRAITQSCGEGAEKRLQLVFYQSGVGVASDFEAKEGVLATEEKALGTAVASKIRDAYNFIAQNYTRGDWICIFGFSRGAYTARKLSGLIDKIGLLPPEQMGKFFTYWKQLNGQLEGEPPKPKEQVRIKCVGTWDTVGSVFKKIDALKLVDTRLPPCVDIALHAIAFHENRNKFAYTPYSGASPNQILKQVWFPGAHSDVGGGYANHQLADVSLAWMVGEIESFIGVNKKFIKNSMSDSRDSGNDDDKWGAAKPKNAYQETPFLEGGGTVIREENRSGQLSKDSVIHPSLLQSPPTKDLLHISALKAKGWIESGHVVDLNDYEVAVKKHWFDQPKDGDVPQFEGFNEMESMF